MCTKSDNNTLQISFTDFQKTRIGSDITHTTEAGETSILSRDDALTPCGRLTTSSIFNGWIYTSLYHFIFYSVVNLSDSDTLGESYRKRKSLKQQTTKSQKKTRTRSTNSRAYITEVKSWKKN